MKVYKGETVAPGVALGVVRLQGFGSEDEFPLRISSDQVEQELNDLRAAIDESRSQIEDLKSKHSGDLDESEARIFDVHIEFLRDPMFVDEIEKLVLAERYSVRAAIRHVSERYDRIFELVEDEYLRRRAGDLRDVAVRVMRNLPPLEGQKPVEDQPGDGRYVLVAKRLTVNDLFRLDNERVEGIVTEEGGILSHAGILARSMGIPTVTGVPDLPKKVGQGSFVILDAGAGELRVDPDERLRAEYERAAEDHRLAPSAQIDERAHQTRDGSELRLLGACGNLSEIEQARGFGMDGIGLYRTELLFLVEDRLPTEDVLEHHYREVARQSGQGPLWFRLLDVTSYHQVPGLRQDRERNPALGLRGIRALLNQRKVLRLQLRAILRATAGHGDVAVLVPFVTSMADLQQVRAAAMEERHELRKRGVDCVQSLRIVPIIEVPAAAFVGKAFLDECDFMVVSLDDLQALLIAADRDSSAVRAYYDMPHPAMLELLARMSREARQLGKELVLFGEALSDAQMLPFYLGIGVKTFVMSPVHLTRVIDVASRMTVDECRQIADKLLEAPRALDIQRILLRRLGQR